MFRYITSQVSFPSNYMLHFSAVLVKVHLPKLHTTQK